MANSSQLLEQTLVLLRRDKRSIAALHRDTGLAYHWLRKMRAGQIRNPGFKRVAALHEKLAPHA